MRKQLIALGIMLHFSTLAPAQVSFGFGFQTDNVSISLSTYPNLVRVPGYPVYYAAGLNSNYFFYDGMYWIFESDRWYSSSWYNGPWLMVNPEFIPLYLLRVPVRYYRRPPAFFRGFQASSPPHWDDHWGNEWSQRRRGWDHWNRQSMPAPAPLPTYQRKYSGERYPSPDRQPALQNQNYRHEARDPLVRQQYQTSPQQRRQPEAAQRDREEAPQAPQPQRARESQDQQRQSQAAPRSEERPQRNDPQPQRDTNMRPQAEPRQQHGQTPNEDRPGPRPPDSGQHSGQQRERDNPDQHGQGRGR